MPNWYFPYDAPEGSTHYTSSSIGVYTFYKKLEGKTYKWVEGQKWRFVIDPPTRKLYPLNKKETKCRII